MSQTVSLKLADDQGTEGPLNLGEVELGEESPPPVVLIGKNISTHRLRRVNISVDGTGSKYVQLGNDAGSWAAPGSPILVADVLAPGDEFVFLSRLLPPKEEDQVGAHNFEYVVNSTSIGSD